MAKSYVSLSIAAAIAFAAWGILFQPVMTSPSTTPNGVHASFLR